MAKVLLMLKKVPSWAWIALAVVLFILIGGMGIFRKITNQLTSFVNNLRYGMSYRPDGGSDTGGSGGSGGSGTGSSGRINLMEIAQGIYDAFYQNDWLGVSEDEEKAMALLINVPDEYINDLASAYSAIKGKGKDLRADFRRLLNNTQYELVRSKLIG